MRRPLLFLLPILIACGGGAGESPPVNDLILVSGSDMGVLFQSIYLSVAEAPLSGVQVLVNGTPIPEIQSGHYSGQLPAALAAGSPVQVIVIAGVDTVIGSTTVPSPPVLFAPVSGTAIHIGTPVDFTWTDAGNPDAFAIAIQYNGTSEVANYGPTVRSGSVVTSRIPNTATNVSAYVFAYGNGTFTGRRADPASRMRVRQPAPIASLVIGP